MKGGPPGPLLLFTYKMPGAYSLDAGTPCSQSKKPIPRGDITVDPWEVQSEDPHYGRLLAPLAER